MSQVDVQTGVVELKSASASALKGDDTSSFTPVQFPKPFPEGSNVIVVPMTQTFHGPDTPGVRIADVTHKGFKIRINELVHSSNGTDNLALSNGIHVSETIGWAAFTMGDTLSGGGTNGGGGSVWHGMLDASWEVGVQSNVTVSSGDKISITVTGKGVYYGDPFGPDGNPNVQAPANALLPGENQGAVLMRIGDSNPYRVVGSRLSDYTVQEDGEIAFFYNDVKERFYGNQGGFAITLTRE